MSKDKISKRAIVLAYIQIQR